jgi:hypothetical protein
MVETGLPPLRWHSPGPAVGIEFAHQAAATKPARWHTHRAPRTAALAAPHGCLPGFRTSRPASNDRAARLFHPQYPQGARRRHARRCRRAIADEHGPVQHRRAASCHSFAARPMRAANVQDRSRRWDPIFWSGMSRPTSSDDAIVFPDAEDITEIVITSAAGILALVRIRWTPSKPILRDPSTRQDQDDDRAGGRLLPERYPAGSGRV